MILLLQIKSLILSFIYGMFFRFTFEKNKKILLHKNNGYKILINLLFIIDHTLIYFILLRKINNSILHIYYFPLFILGFLFYKVYFTHNKNKNWLYKFKSDILKMNRYANEMSNIWKEKKQKENFY